MFEARETRRSSRIKSWRISLTLRPCDRLRSDMADRNVFSNVGDLACCSLTWRRLGEMAYSHIVPDVIDVRLPRPNPLVSQLGMPRLIGWNGLGPAFCCYTHRFHFGLKASNVSGFRRGGRFPTRRLSPPTVGHPKSQPQANSYGAQGQAAEGLICKNFGCTLHHDFRKHAWPPEGWRLPSRCQRCFAAPKSILAYRIENRSLFGKMLCAPRGFF